MDLSLQIQSNVLTSQHSTNTLRQGQHPISITLQLREYDLSYHQKTQQERNGASQSQGYSSLYHATSPNLKILPKDCSDVMDRIF